MSLTEADKINSEPKLRHPTGGAQLDLGEGVWGRVIGLAYAGDAATDRNPLPVVVLHPDRKSAELALAEEMADGVLDNITATPLGKRCTAYFMTGDDPVHRQAHDIVCAAIGLDSPEPLMEESGVKTTYGNLELLVSRRAIGAVNASGEPMIDAAPHSVWYEIITTSVPASYKA